VAELPEYLNDQTFEIILQRMLDAIPDDIDKSEGSFIYDVLASVAAELAQAAIWAQEVLRRGFAQTTFGQYLDLRCAEHGLTRKPAVKATGQVVFTGIPGTVIPVGTQMSTVGSEATPAIFFATTEEVTIGEDGTATANIEAVKAGTSGNVAAGAISLLAQPLSGVVEVTNPEPTSGGTDEESDEELLQRLLERMQRPPDTGNKYDYVRWAKEVPGVGDAICIPLWNGPGTVKVVIVDSNGAPASQELIEAVQDYISPAPETGEGRAPIGANVTVSAPETVPINVSATLSYTQGYDPATVQAAVEEAVESYINSLKIGEDVKYFGIANAIYITPGVEDCIDLLVNGGTDNVAVSDEEKAIKGAVTLT